MTIEITGSTCGQRYCWTLFGKNKELVCMGVNNYTGDNSFASKSTAIAAAQRFIDRYIHHRLRVPIKDWNGTLLGGQNLY